MFGSDEDFARAERFEGAGDFGGVDFGGAEFAGGDVDVGEACAIAGAMNGGQVVVFVGAEEVRVGCGAGRDDAGDLAFDEFFAGGRLLPSARRWRRDSLC